MKKKQLNRERSGGLRLLSILLAVVMLCGLLIPGGAMGMRTYADETDEAAVAESAVIEDEADALPVEDEAETPAETPTEEPAVEETPDVPAAEETPAEPPAQEETPAADEPEKADEADEPDAADVLYDQLMACTTCEQMYSLLKAADVECVETLSYDELTDLIDYAETLAEDDAKEDLVFDLTALRDNEAAMTPGGGGSGKPGDGKPDGGTGGNQQNECDQSYYQSTAAVYWDTMTYNRTTGTGSSYAAGRSLVTSVMLTSKTVKQANATSPSSASNGTAMSTYFSGATTTTEVSSTLTITPAAGYYITDVVIACTGGSSNESAFQCNTWSEGNAFTKGFDVGTSGSVSITVSSKDFSHRSQAQKVFILIAVAPIPSPLYVEYWPGSITDVVGTSDTIFQDSDDWTTQGTGNVLGTGEVQTNYTQYEYAYTTSSTEAANWKHYANSITDAAKTAAANAGYYFTGWKVEYYTSCTATSTGNTDRAYTYTFTDSYGESTAQPGGEVHLTTNCKIIAQWAPIQLKMTKTVEELSSIDEFKSNSNTYKLTLQKQNADGTYADVQTDVEYTITGDGTLTYTFGAGLTDNGQKNVTIAPGTYKVVETGNYDLKGSSENAYCTTTYPAETVTVSADGTVQELKVLNTYSSTPAAYTLTVKKTLSGNMYEPNDKFAFTVTYGESTETFELGHNDTKTITIPVGASVSVTEDAGGYTYSLTAVTPKGLKYDNVSNNDSDLIGISFTMPESDVSVTINNEKEITIDTGVMLDSLPYLVILAAAVVGVAVVMIRKRRMTDED